MTESRLDYLLGCLRDARKRKETGETCSLVWARERQEIVRMAEEWGLTDEVLKQLPPRDAPRKRESLSHLTYK